MFNSSSPSQSSRIMLPTQRRVLGSPTRTLLKGASRNVLRTSTQLLSKTQYRSLTIKDLDSGKDRECWSIRSRHRPSF